MTAQLVADLMLGVFADLFGVCQDIAAAALPAWEGVGGLPLRDDVCIDEVCRAALRGSVVPLAGAGLVLSPGVLADQEYWLRWWQPSDAGDDRALRIQLDPSALDFRDYTTLPWFAVPARTGVRHVTGPYVDYLCTDCYTLTLTLPLAAEGRTIGVCGVDVLVRTLETHLFAAVPADGPEWLVVTDGGRVVTGGSSDRTTGDLFSPAEGAGWDVVPCPGLPVSVLSRAG